MKKIYTSLFLALLAVTTANAQYTPDENFDKGWRFYNEEAQGAQSPTFDDSKWRKLNLPHDWAIEGPFSADNDCRTGALPVDGIGWYRKTFTLPSSAKGKVIRLEFEGAMANSTLYINGKEVGFHPYGYTGFEYDITKYLKFDGTENSIAMRLAPEDFSSRWYPGAGIYRSVWLKIDEPIYVDNYGVYVTTPTADKRKSVAQNETTIINSTSKEETIEVQHDYYDPSNNKVASVMDKITVAPNSKALSQTYTNITDAKLWNPETPYIYSVKTTILKDGKEMDSYATKFGIRAITYDTKGFYINGKQIRFNGVCLHHDNGALGSAVYRRADERKLEILKQMGCNSIRTSHNPPSREFLELCDSMGLMVLDEAFDCWELPKVKNGYNKFFNEWSERDLSGMIKRDRNHPSVVMWSIGNEIMEQWQPVTGWRVAKRLNDICKIYDPTRPTTAGFNSPWQAYEHNIAQQVDIAGMNYKPFIYKENIEKYPQIPFYGSETSSCNSSRGVYHFPLEKYKKHPSLQITSYDFVGLPWAYAPEMEFHYQKQNTSIMGEFVWTGFDYLGENSPYGGKDNDTGDGHWNSDYPSRSSYFGICDLAGFPKDRYYNYQSEWTTEPMIHILPHWNWKGKEGDTIPVMSYTNCQEAELFLNGKSLGRRVKGVDKVTLPTTNMILYKDSTYDSEYRLQWEVPYEAGELKVVGYIDGKAAAEKIIRTSGKATKIILSADREEITADGRDLSYVTITIVDKDGNFCPMADNLVSLEVEGEGELIGVDNGDAASITSFQADKIKAFSGLALGIIRSNEDSGTITIKAKAKGLKSNAITIETK